MQPVPREPRDERLARELREQIYAGRPAVGERLDSADVLAARAGVSAAIVQRAYNLLRAEGLVRAEHGRGTFVCPRRRWRATVSQPPAGALPSARSVLLASRSDPAVSVLDVADMTVSDDSVQRVWSMLIEAAEPAAAAAVAVRAARIAGAGEWPSLTVGPD